MNESVESMVSAFTDLLREKPYNKITVKDICSRSFVHRNTFYYHFQDLSELLEYTIRCQEDIILAHYTSTEENPLGFLRCITEYALSRRDLLSNLYHSQGKGHIYRAIHSLTYSLARYYVSYVLVDRGELERSDQEIVIRCLSSVSAGLLTDWLESDFSYDLLADVQRVYELFIK